VQVINELIKVLGNDKVVTDESSLEKYARDFWPLLMMREQVFNEKPPRPAAVVLSSNENDVATALKVINGNEKKIPVVIYGGGSSVTGSSAGGGSIVIDMVGLNKVLDIDIDDQTITVEAGAKLRDVETKLNEAGHSLRHVPQSFDYATIGGLIATMSSGEYSTLYGNIEDITLNLEVVLPSGKITWLRRNTVPRASTGPSLKHLFVGSEGLLGIITKAVLRIVPLPAFTIYGSYAFRSINDGIKALRELMINRITPAIARLYDEYESSIRFGTNKPTLIINFEGYNDDLVTLMWSKAREIIMKHDGESTDDEFFNLWYKNRFNIDEEIDRVKKLGLWFDTIEVAGTWSRLPLIYEGIRNSIINIEGVVAVMAHVSHLYINGACIYFTVLFRPSNEAYWKIWDAAMEATLRNGGSISHHHGIGILRSRWINEELGEAINIFRNIKDSLDQDEVMNARRGMFFPK